MSYSCVDLTDEILDLCVRRKLIKAEQIPDDDPREQAYLIGAGIEKLVTENGRLKRKLKRSRAT